MRIDELERELRAQREEPESEFARELDEWAAAGFRRPRGSRRAERLRGWLAARPPRRLLLPAGAVATVVVVAGVAISQTGSTGDELSPQAGELPPAASTVADPATGPADPAPESLTAPEAGLGETAGSPEAAQDDSAAAEPLPPGSDLVAPPGGAGGIARGTDERIVDATARISLAAEEDEVQNVANGVVEVTDRYHGVVLDSQVTSDQGGARASFSLEIPYRQLDAALSDLSGLADVISRTEGAQDITAQAVRARKDLAQTLERLREARIDLIRADTREQRLVIKSQIASLEATADAYETELNSVKRQGRFASVSVEVTSNGPGSDDGDWGLGDALDDAASVLETIGGIALVSLAILLPLGLVAALVALVVARARRRGRERALDAS